MPTEVSHLGTAGSYDATWNSLALGKTEDGWNWEVSLKGEIQTFEEWGESPIDMVYRGAEVFVEAVLKEWSAAALATAIWPFDSTTGAIDCPGHFAVDGAFAKPLVLTANSCTPAAADGPATITFPNTILAPDFVRTVNLNNRMRLIPVRFLCFLDDIDTGTGVDARFWQVT